VISLFQTTDGGATWTAVSSNLEEHPDGSGDGPSIRCAKKLVHQGKTIYLAGSSCGLFSTRVLKGDSTVWVKEGANSIGNVIVDDIDVRQNDGFMAIATHGNGVYSGYFNPAASIEEGKRSERFTIGNPYPIPASDKIQVMVQARQPLRLSARLVSLAGETVAFFGKLWLDGGEQTLSFPVAGLSAGSYLLVVSDGSAEISKKVVVLR
jgi:hypothetical protein